MTFHQLEQTFTVVTPLGVGVVNFVSQDKDETYWGVFQKQTGELWWWRNHEIRYGVHISEGFHEPTPIVLSKGAKTALAFHMLRYDL